MSITSIRIPAPVTPHLDHVVGDQSSRLSLYPPIGMRAGGSTCQVGVESPPQQTNGVLKPKLNGHFSESEPVTKPQYTNGVPKAKENGNISEPEPNIKPLALSPPPPKSITERAKAAAAVLNRYRIEYKNDWDIPESILYSQGQIHKALERKVPIELVIPAFPFKSSNRSKKVLGPLPDEAERVSLLHLNSLCLAIKDAAESDAFLTIVSDGITYNGKNKTFPIF
jgi:hypothetical protein